MQFKLNRRDGFSEFLVGDRYKGRTLYIASEFVEIVMSLSATFFVLLSIRFECVRFIYSCHLHMGI